MNTALLQCHEVEEEGDSSANQREGEAEACPGSPSHPPSLMPSMLCCTALPSVPVRLQAAIPYVAAQNEGVVRLNISKKLESRPHFLRQASEPFFTLCCNLLL